MFSYHRDGKRVEMVPGVHRQLLASGDRVMVVQVTLAKDSVVPVHTHPHEQVGHVAAGRLRFQLGEREAVLGPGDAYAIPPNVPHGCVALEDSIAVDSFSPPREDYRD